MKKLVVALPYLFLLQIALLALLARQEVGHWPSFHNPDPKTLFEWYGDLVLCWGVLLAGALFGGLWFYRTATRRANLLGGLGWWLILLFFYTDFCGLPNWLLD